MNKMLAFFERHIVAGTVMRTERLTPGVRLILSVRQILRRTAVARLITRMFAFSVVNIGRHRRLLGGNIRGRLIYNSLLRNRSLCNRLLLGYHLRLNLLEPLLELLAFLFLVLVAACSKKPRHPKVLTASATRAYRVFRAILPPEVGVFLLHAYDSLVVADSSGFPVQDPASVFADCFIVLACRRHCFSINTFPSS
jgi:hypothetical protein